MLVQNYRAFRITVQYVMLRYALFLSFSPLQMPKPKGQSPHSYATLVPRTDRRRLEVGGEVRARRLFEVRGSRFEVEVGLDEATISSKI